ncbi:MAG: TatD family hydrolase [Dehalococcoidia bacterium]
MILFDTHCHLQDRAFDGEIDGAIARAREAGVLGMTLCGYDPESNLRTLAIAANHPGVFPAVGYHPHDAKDITPDLLDELERLASLPQVVAVGEIGLDHFRDHSPHAVQAAILRDELAIALRLHKPVSVHTRAAEDAIREPLAAFGRAWTSGDGRFAGVLHCFGGTLEQAAPLVDVGFAVSFACAITYPKNTEARRMAANLPLDAIVVETDSPYLPPQRLRGQRNEPAHISSAVQAIAEARGVAIETIAAATTRNAERLFGVRVAPPAGVTA